MPAQVVAAAVAGPRRTRAMNTMPPAPRQSETSEVLDVVASSRPNVRAAIAHQNLARGGFRTAAAAQAVKAKAMLLPRAFFSGHRPRQAPGNSSVIRPIDGMKRPVIRQQTARMAKQVAITSASRAQRQRAASTRPASVVQ